MNEPSYVNFNGSYECEFKLNKMYKNVIGIRLDKSIYENPDGLWNGSQSNMYLDVIINNIPRETCINNLKGYNIIKRLPYEHIYPSSIIGPFPSTHYDSGFSKPNYFYPINLDKLSLSLKYNYKENGKTDLIDLKSKNLLNFGPKVFADVALIGLKFSFEFELTILNR